MLHTTSDCCGVGRPGTDRHHDYSASRLFLIGSGTGRHRRGHRGRFLGGWVPLPDGVVRAETDPVGDRPVLLHLLSQGHLGAEGLVGRLPGQQRGAQTNRRCFERLLSPVRADERDGSGRHDHKRKKERGAGKTAVGQPGHASCE